MTLPYTIEDLKTRVAPMLKRHGYKRIYVICTDEDLPHAREAEKWLIEEGFEVKLGHDVRGSDNSPMTDEKKLAVCKAITWSDVAVMVIP